MVDGLYITPNKFISFEELNTSSLKQEIASRSAAWDFSGIIGLLPDPDPILQKLGNGVEVLQELTADGHLTSIMQSRKLGTLKQEFVFNPGTDENEETTSQSEQLCKDFNRDLASIKTRDLVSSILDTPFYGMTPIELTFEPGSYLHLKKIEAKPVRWFGFDEKNEPRFRSIEESEEGEKLPWGKFVFARHFPTYDNPYGLRLLTRCFWPITFKRGGLKFWVSFMEKYGMPFLLGHYAKGTPPDEQQAMLTKLERMVRNAVAVVPDGDRIEMLGGSGKTGGGYMMFDKMRGAMDAEMSKVILGQTLTTEAGEKGSYGLGKVHDDVLSDFQESDKVLAKETLDEIAVIFARANSDGVPPPTCKFYEAEDPQSDFADRDKTLEENGRFKLKKSYYVRRYGFHEDDFEIVESETPGADPTPEKTPIDHSEKEDPFSAENQLALATKAQGELDSQVEEYTREGSDFFSDFKKQIRSWLKEKESLEAALATITTLFDDLPVQELQSSLMSALMVADRLGTGSVPGPDNFAEAVYGAGKPFREAIDFFQAKALTIAGVARNDLVASVKDELLRTMEEGGNIKDFRNRIDEIFISKGLDPLSDHHINTIYRTNMQTAFQAGRYVQLTKPHILKARPYWKYVSIRDGVTRPAHAEMNGKIFHHENAIWQIWYPPNGFNCRCQVVSLSAREIERDGLQVEENDISGTAFEHINKETGEVKKYVLDPDPGWGADGGSLERLLNKQKKKSGGAQLWREKKGQPGPVELGRPTKGQIDIKHWVGVSQGPRLADLIKGQNLTEKEGLAQIESNYRKLMGISPLETQSVVRSKDGEALTVTMQALAHAIFSEEDGRERFIPYLRHTLENPYEILLTEYETPGGKPKYRKKYIGLFSGEKMTGVVIVGEITNNGTVMWNIMNTKKGNIDRQRHGVKLLYGRE